MVINILIHIELVEVIQSFCMLEFIGYSFVIINGDKVGSPKYTLDRNDSNSWLVIRKNRFNNPKSHVFIRSLSYKLEIMNDSTAVMTVTKVK